MAYSHFFITFFIFFLFETLVRASPIARREELPAPVVQVLSLPSSSIEDESLLTSNLTTIASAISNNSVSAEDASAAYISVLDAVVAGTDPSSIEKAISLAAAALAQATPPNIISYAAELKLKGTTSDTELQKRRPGGIDSYLNNNKKNPSATIYPKKSSTDAPYSVPEASLRAALYIPSSFKYGANGKVPVILVPGTAVSAGSSFENNLSPLLASSSFADPLWVNIPGTSLGDVQISAEYVAYAINYISSICGSRKVAVVTWSQGSLNTQWGLKYWPSTRDAVSDFVALSPDFHGSMTADILCPLLGLFGCTPSVMQQRYNSKFIATLRGKGGDSAFVPTTTVYSGTDEVVQPQRGKTASGYIQDSRSIGVSNNYVQDLCPGQVAGKTVLHGGILYNALAWALIEDALTHDGPGKTSRLSLSKVCKQAAAPGLTAVDVIATHGSTNINAALNILMYVIKGKKEPSMKAYAI
ncbi:alpha/beta-hydrolase [Patellaria atrata CBS 101060]|uniref:Alpha/beta-hydrolase n=1 Tax=Patellaria atrata CBS 101060 TaxID=1346257 RepID=A0A9P4VRN4_9PEZI|nr:alpha/beta-hydrolase [Patellaria atrata CBS 101060]